MKGIKKWLKVTVWIFKKFVQIAVNWIYWSTAMQSYKNFAISVNYIFSKFYVMTCIQTEIKIISPFIAFLMMPKEPLFEQFWVKN